MRARLAVRAVATAACVSVLWLGVRVSSPDAWAGPSAGSSGSQPSVQAPSAPPLAPGRPGKKGAGGTLDDLCTTACTSNSACSSPDYCVLGCCANPSPRDKAEQRSPVTRSGHELLTVLSAAAALAENANVLGANGAAPLPAQSGCASNACSHGADKSGVFSAVMGVRWADLMGFRAGPLFPAQQRCLSAVAQDNEEVQYDHALRRRDDAGADGGLRAINGIRRRLLERFTAAVLADEALVEVADGGAAQDHFKALRTFFLLGRALHIVQDSFSTFHTERSGKEFAELRQVNSYVCTPGAPPHPHVTPGVVNLLAKDARSANGDIIRRAGCSRDTLDCLKPEYVASVTASKQLWLAFSRARAAKPSERARAAATEITSFLDTWFKVPASVAVAPAPKEPCVIDSVATIDARRLACLRMTGRGEGLDAPFSWKRVSFTAIPD